MKRHQLLDPLVLSKLPPIALKALRVVEGAITGLHQSPHHGQSIEFTEHKEYTPGDELRHIDWKLYGKSDKYYVKQFEDETNMRAYLLLDSSASMGYPENEDGRPSKFTFASILALSVAYMLLRQHDAVGLFTFQDKLQTQLPPKNKPSYLIPMAKTIEDMKPKGKTALLPVMRNLAELLRRRSLIVIFSDFFADTEESASLLKQFAYQGHDLVVFHVLDKDELEFPFRDQTLFEDMEQPSQTLQIDAQAIKPYYLQEMEAFLKGMKKMTNEAGIEYWQVDTSQPSEEILHRFLLHRHHIRRRRK